MLHIHMHIHTQQVTPHAICRPVITVDATNRTIHRERGGQISTERDRVRQTDRQADKTVRERRIIYIYMYTSYGAVRAGNFRTSAAGSGVVHTAAAAAAATTSPKSPTDH